jgi:hypothetical protein
MPREKDKTALTVKITLEVRVVVDDTWDLNIDPEFEQATMKAIKERMKEEGSDFIAAGIEDYQNDLENPYDPEYDD